MLGFVYLQYDRKRKMFYLGSHIGRIDDGYVGSGKHFLNAYKKRPLDFRRRIIEIIEFSNFSGHWNKRNHPVRISEQRWLNIIKPEELGKRYYNHKLEVSGWTTEDGIKMHLIKDERGKSVCAVNWGRKGSAKVHSAKDERGKSICAVNWGRKGCAKNHSIKDENGKSLIAIKAGIASNIVKDKNGKSVNGIKRGITANLIKNQEGKSVNAVKGATAANSIKDENGKSTPGVKGGAKTHSIKDANGKSINGIKYSTRLNLIKDETDKSVNAVKGGHSGGRKGMHVRYHINRNMINPNYIYCNAII